MPDIDAGCTGKKGYPNGTLAWRILTRRMARTRDDHEAKPGALYRCPHCGHWHIGRRF